MIVPHQALREIPEDSRQAAVLRSLIHTAYHDPAATFNVLALDHDILPFPFLHREDHVDRWFTCTWMLQPGGGLVMSLLVEEQMGGLAPPSPNPLRFMLPLVPERKPSQSSTQQALVTQMQSRPDAGAASSSVTSAGSSEDAPPGIGAP